MIVKERSYPLKAAKDQVLLGRLLKNHPQYPIIEADFHREDAGYWGEKALDYHLSFLPDGQYFIFQHLRVKYQQWTFQMDFLLLTIRMALILEAKYYTGSLHFENNFAQLIQTKNDKTKSYEDPTAQAERQRFLLTNWLQKYFPQYFLPIDYLVVMSNPNAILTADPNNTRIIQKVCKPYRLLDKIKELDHLYQQERMDMKALKKLCKLLLKHHTPKQTDILREYQIPEGDILTGVICPLCKALPMIYRRGVWICPVCGCHSNDAHLAAISDYFYLYPTITNSQCQDFLHLPTRHIAQKTLQSMNLPFTGNTKGRIYFPKKGQ